MALVDEIESGVRLAAPDAVSLRDAIGDEIGATGVDPETGAVNVRGQALDALIDRVGALSDLYEAR